MSESVIRTEDVPHCPVCGADERRVMYRGLKDRLFGAPGEWTLKECCRCGTVYPDPRPTLDDIGRAYATYYTHSAPASPKGNSPVHLFYRAVKAGYLGVRWGYDHGLKGWQKLLAPLLYLHPGRRSQLDFTVMYLKAVPGGSLLDVGCGSGGLIERMQDLGWRVKGLDLDAIAVREVRRRGLDVDLGTLEQRSYPEASFDAVVLSHVIEHVHDPHALLSECRRVLKPDGRVMVATPNARSLGHKLFERAWRGLEPPRHLQILTPPALRLLVKRASFERCSIVTTMQGADYLYAASKAIERNGVYSEGEAQTKIERVRSRLAQHLEWLVIKMIPDAGEEIVALLEK